ncbi:MAG: PilZ domain-containing protein [Acidobacteria bacterium]|nr:PilZ domain-containing protein [Acidobacteriota bacterium]
MKAQSVTKERRKWPRLALAIPVFVRSRDLKGKEVLEFASALNVSASGALIAVRRAIPLSSRVSLEIPSAPVGESRSMPKTRRKIAARAMRMIHTEGFHLIGMKFTSPLQSTPAQSIRARRKVASPK